jgi:hypothetical protein
VRRRPAGGDGTTAEPDKVVDETTGVLVEAEPLTDEERAVIDSVERNFRRPLRTARRAAIAPRRRGTGAGRKCGPQDYCLKLETTAVEAGEP